MGATSLKGTCSDCGVGWSDGSAKAKTVIYYLIASSNVFVVRLLAGGKGRYGPGSNGTGTEAGVSGAGAARKRRRAIPSVGKGGPLGGGLREGEFLS